jgi:hypothetical protein
MPTLLKKTILLCIGAIVVTAGNGLSQPSAPATPKQKTTVKTTAQKKSQAVKTDTVVAAKIDSSKLKADSTAAIDSTKLVRILKVTTDPTGASVYLDDSLKGESPCTVTGIVPGGHVLTLKKKGCYLKKAEISADSTLPQELAFTLLQPGFLKVITTPSGADVELDGKREGATPYENERVKPGDHTVRLSLNQYTPVERTLKTGSATHDTLQIKLEHTAAYLTAYNDSVAVAQKAADKVRRDKNSLEIVSGIFGICAVVLVVIEFIASK